MNNYKVLFHSQENPVLLNILIDAKMGMFNVDLVKSSTRSPCSYYRASSTFMVAPNEHGQRTRISLLLWQFIARRKHACKS